MHTAADHIAAGSAGIAAVVGVDTAGSARRAVRWGQTELPGSLRVHLLQGDTPFRLGMHAWPCPVRMLHANHKVLHYPAGSRTGRHTGVAVLGTSLGCLDSYWGIQQGLTFG